MKDSAFVIDRISHIGTPTGTLYTNKSLLDVEIWDLVFETKSVSKGEYKNEFKITAVNNSLRINGKLLGFIHNGQYFEA
jgi:hypothetical protein